MKYGLTKRGANVVIVLPDGTGVQICRCKVANAAGQARAVASRPEPACSQSDLTKGTR